LPTPTHPGFRRGGLAGERLSPYILGTPKIPNLINPEQRPPEQRPIRLGRGDCAIKFHQQAVVVHGPDRASPAARGHNSRADWCERANRTQPGGIADRGGCHERHVQAPGSGWTKSSVLLRAKKGNSTTEFCGGFYLDK
jgi:hypothetical protein